MTQWGILEGRHCRSTSNGKVLEISYEIKENCLPNRFALKSSSINQNWCINLTVYFGFIEKQEFSHFGTFKFLFSFVQQHANTI